MASRPGRPLSRKQAFGLNTILEVNESALPRRRLSPKQAFGLNTIREVNESAFVNNVNRGGGNRGTPR